ncbi:MAG: hypothetical protein ACI912_000654, partial [Marinobacter psychrophilus]
MQQQLIADFCSIHDVIPSLLLAAMESILSCKLCGKLRCRITDNIRALSAKQWIPELA